DGLNIFLEATEFLRIYAGEKSRFYKLLASKSPSSSASYLKESSNIALNSYINFVENGLGQGLSFERQAKIDVVSDFLDQARILLETKNVHPAAPCVLIGASLEEFLRNWVEEAELSIGNSKPSLDSFSKALKAEEMLSKQDMKDIGSWAGLRNHAAHGEWDEVNDRKRISIMLEGVNFFMRKYSKE